MQKTESPKRVLESQRQRSAFGQAIYQLRMSRNLSQEELAFRSDLDRSYISILERGGKEPCLGAIIRLGKALDTSLPDLLSIFDKHYAENSASPRKRVR